MNLNEQKLQSECYIWFHNNYPDLRGRLFAINNNSENALKGSINKAVGVVAGVADMALITDNMVYFLEFKTAKGVQTPRQRAFELQCRGNATRYIVIKDFKTFKELIYSVILAIYN